MTCVLQAWYVVWQADANFLPTSPLKVMFSWVGDFSILLNHDLLPRIALTIWLLDCYSNIKTMYDINSTKYCNISSQLLYTRCIKPLFLVATEYQKLGHSLARTRIINTKHDLMPTHEDDNWQQFSAWLSGAFNDQDYLICTEDADYQVLLHFSTSWGTTGHHTPHVWLFKLE